MNTVTRHDMDYTGIGSKTDAHTGPSSHTVFEERTPEGGVIRLEKWPDGYVLWLHGEIKWRQRVAV